MLLNKLNQQEIAELLLLEPRSVRNCHKEDPPIPFHGSGKKIWYVWEEVVDWRDRRRHRSLYAAASSKKADVPDEKIERALLTRAQRERTELDTARKRRDALSLQDYEQAMADMIAPARINLLALGAKLRPAIGSDAAAKVEEEIRRVLRDLGGAAPEAKAP
jgi:phage terminase Nu1 subunit (DNA packaging protein)